MKSIVSAILFVLLLVGVFMALSISAPPASGGSSGTSTDALQTPGTLEIYGDVSTPLDLTYAELVSMPMVSEVAELRCVTGSPDVTYNWTGIPLFYLLTLAEIKPDAYKIVTICSDGYTSDLLVPDALQPTTILALEANGTSLPQLTYGPEGPNRLVVPGKYGYKWSSGIESIDVVTFDYKGEYESSGYSDTADVPNYGPMPTPTPTVQTLDMPYGNRTLEVGAFTNASIAASSFDASQKALNVNVTVPEGTSGFADFILQQDFLSRPYNVTLDGKAVSAIEADTNASSYIYLGLTEGFHTVSIIGAEFYNGPEAVVSYPAAVGVGQNVTFDASKSVDVGYIVSYEWSFGDGANGTGAVVSHAYSKGGTYQVTLNVTDNEGLSSLKTFTITVGSPLDILLLIKVFLATMLVALILIFTVLLRKRRTTRARANMMSNRLKLCVYILVGLLLSVAVSGFIYYIVYTHSSAQKTPASPSSADGYLRIFAYYGTQQRALTSHLVEASVKIAGPENLTGTTTTEPSNALTFIVLPGQYTISITFSSLPPQNETVNVQSGGYYPVTVFFTSGPSP